MYCDKCGMENDYDSKFCIKCGSSILPDKSTDNKIEKRFKINFKNVKIPKTIFIILGLLIVLAAVIISIPNANKKNNIDGNNIDSNNIDNNNIDNIEDTVSEQDIQNLKADDKIKVSIDSIPIGANIYIDNVFSGNTPKAINLPEGNYSLKMNLTGYKSIRTEFNITSDMSRQDINATLEPLD